MVGAQPLLPCDWPDPERGRSGLTPGFLLLAVTLAVAGASASVPNPEAPLDRGYTLRLEEPAVVEREHARLILPGSDLSFAFPRPCVSALDSSRICGEDYGWAYQGRDESFRIGPLAAVEYRRGEDGVFAGEGGARLLGHKGPVSFALDARIFSEAGSRSAGETYDREDVDQHDDSTSGSVSYTGYGRFRGGMALDLPFARLTAGRDAIHWGPGLFTNLVFHQDAVPFFHYALRTNLGPLSVISLYGDLAIDDRHISTRNLKSRNLYAHRYELRVPGNVLLGISEQLILYEEDRPYFFLPVVPLFLAKGFMYEHTNNGNIAFDAAWKLPGLLMLYTEFLLDDLESPSSLLTKDYVQNKWGWMAGAHVVRDIGPAATGFVLEYSRVEPYVYTHFMSHTAQAANLGYPLGNPQGPNSQSVVARIYGRREGRIYLAFQAAAHWKGVDRGSGLNDEPPSLLSEKHFLADVDGPEWAAGPVLSYAFRYAVLQCSLSLGEKAEGHARVAFRI